MSVTNIQLTRKMLEYAKKHKLDVPRVSLSVQAWGKGKRTLAWRVSSHLRSHGKRVPEAAFRTNQLVSVFFPAPNFSIRRDYHAIHRSGTRSLSAINFIVLHDMECTAEDTAAEAVGSYFQNPASGGSTNYGVDNNSIQCYLADNVIPWGAPGANTDGVHIEQMGTASWSTKEWFKHAEGTLDRTAWLIAKLAKKLDIPVRRLSDRQVKSRQQGVVTHAQLSRCLGGTHTDPGNGYPLDWVMSRAEFYRDLI